MEPILKPIEMLILVMLASNELKSEKATPRPPITPEYQDLQTFGHYMGCNAAYSAAGDAQGDWVKAPPLPGTYEEYLRGWEEGFDQCRIGLGPAIPPDQLTSPKD